MIYRYQAVTANGCGLHGPQWHKFKDARAHAVQCANRTSAVVLGPFEVHRIGYHDHRGVSRRYWMRSGARWVPWDAQKDHTVRRPDFIAYEPFDPAAPNSRAPRERHNDA